MFMKNAFCLCIVLFSQLSHAEVSEHLEYEYYTAYAQPNRSLSSVVKEASPLRENGKTMDGYTHWHVNWRFWWHESADGRCRMTNVTTDLTATITLPRIVNATTAQETQFNRFVAALRTHELGHYENGRHATMKIDSEILALPEMASCKTLGATANDLGNSILKEYNAMDVQYDAATDHGRTQGANLAN
jgi:predicted secreted Zn-dependent protease